MNSTSNPIGSGGIFPRSMIRTFAGVGFFWLAISVALLYFFSERIQLSATWFAFYWALCMADLYALSRTLFSVLNLMTHEDAVKRSAHTVQALFWGTIKLVCLGLIGLAVLYGQKAPSLALFLGLGTLAFVPLIGGFQWSQKELNHA